MINALRLVLAGGVYLPPEILSQAASPGSGRPAGPGEKPVTPEDIGLTGRQNEVLALLVQGKPNKLICRELGLAEGTVKIHISAILRTLGVSNRTQAVVAVSQLGMTLSAIGARPGAAGPGAS
jgi:DNA-binding NarL/FixJ family response regulator